MDLIERVSHPSAAQVEALVSFLEERPSLAKGFIRNPNAKARAFKEWEKITSILNSSGGGAIKCSKKWIKYWSDKKSAVKKKTAARNAARRKTGGGVEEIPELSVIEERIVALLGGGRFATGDEHLQLHVFDETPIPVHVNSEQIIDGPRASQWHALALDDVNLDTNLETNMAINPSPQEREPTPEQIRETTTARCPDNPSTTLTPRRRTFRAMRRSPPSQRRSQFNSMADKFLKLEDQRLSHEGRVVKVMEEMAHTHNVLAEGVKALGEGLKSLGEGLKLLAESIKINK